MPWVVFPSLGERIEGVRGDRLLDLCERHSLPMDAACGGFAACNTCRVRVIAGTLSPVEEVEEPFLDRADQRLACQAYLAGEWEVVLEMEPG